MRRLLYVLVAVAGTFSAPALVAQMVGEDPETGGAAKARRHFAKWYAPYENGFPPEVIDRMWRDIHAMPSEITSPDNPNPGWRCIGPFGFNSNYLPNGPSRWTGRVLDLEVFQNGELRFAAASGGLWSAFFGAAPLSDSVTSLAVGSFDTRPDDRNTIVVGTGEAGTSTGGTGIWKTTDRGATWRRVYALYLRFVNKIRFDPAVPGLVHAATDDGYLRSTDYGETWTRRLGLYAWDLTFAMDDQARLIYLVVDGSGLRRSRDDGLTWETVGEGVPSGGNGRGTIDAVRPAGSTRSTIYVEFSTGDSLLGIFKSINAGTTWSNVTPPRPVTGTHQAGYNHALGVCPTNPDIALVGWVKFYRTSNGGQTWIMVDNLVPENHDRTHDDWHEFTWTGGSQVYGANDGGVFVSNDYGVTWGPALAYNVAPITQFYGFDVGGNNPSVIYGGSQDNGVIGTTNGGAGWLGTQCCDGGGVAIDPGNASIVYAVAGSFPPPRGGVRTRSTNYGLDWQQIGPALGPGSVIRHDRTPPVLLFTDNGMQVATSADAGTGWNQLGTGSLPASVNDISVGPGYAGVDAAVYAMLAGGSFRVYDQGAWHSRTNGLPAGYQVRKVAVHPVQPNVAFALMDGNHPALDGRKVFRTTDRGLTWSNITGNLPNLPLADLVAHPLDPNLLYLATSLGCFKTSTAGSVWFRWSMGMPQATIVTELKLIDSLAINGKLYVAAATYGRSIWIRDVSTDDPLTSRFSRCCVIIPILDNTTVRDTMRFTPPPGSGMVQRVTVTLDSILHRFDGDLIMTLLHAGVRDTLVNRVGGESRNFIATTFDDESTIPLSAGMAPFTGVFRPVQPLSRFNGLPAGGDWILEVRDVQTGNTGELRGWSMAVSFGAPTAVEEPRGEVPRDFALEQNYPNPFNPVTTIAYRLPEASRVTLAVFDVMGREVARLLDGVEEAGSRTVRFDASGLASGVYFYRLQAGGRTAVKKLTILR